MQINCHNLGTFLWGTVIKIHEILIFTYLKGKIAEIVRGTHSIFLEFWKYRMKWRLQLKFSSAVNKIRSFFYSFQHNYFLRCLINRIREQRIRMKSSRTEVLFSKRSGIGPSLI